jgi:tetratricopeptide (TPR) repeat protein
MVSTPGEDRLAEVARGRPLWPRLLGVFALLIAPAAAFSLDLDECQQLLVRGDFATCRSECKTAIKNGAYGEGWRMLKAEAEMALGEYQAARETLQQAMEMYSWSVKLRCRLRDALRYTGDAALVPALDAEIARLVEASPWRYTDAENLVLLGWLALDMGGDAKEVQEQFFQRARRNNPVHRLPRLALGQLALDKRDYPLAAETFREASETFKDDPELLFGLAEAVAGSDEEEAETLRARVAELNPRYIPLVLANTDHLIEAEAYEDAEEQLSQVLGINPKHPEALAYWAVIAHLRNDLEQERELRGEALAAWSTNPQVDYIIGRELAQKYRFAEAAAYQRQALAFDATYAPARKELATDLLRLGQEAEGWELVEAAHNSDQYDVTLYNLITLKDAVDDFATIEADGFIIRMDQHEAAVYGERVRALLSEAKQQLAAKYRIELTQPVVVEIFPHPSDFAVRTFGMPGVAGYLGVCFGNVITANSPASQDLSPANWESVLWHEFTHVITLNLTHNKMPRWVSEGISVYEERQRDAAWGERMTPAYREMILGEDLTPVGQLSGAFLNPKSAAHVQFAYYESSLVIEYIIDRYGFDALHAVLLDLGAGVTVNDALDRHVAALPELEEGFAKYATTLAKEFGPEVDWSAPDLTAGDGTPEERLKQFIEQHPNNFSGLALYAELLLSRENIASAEPILRKLIQLYPTATGSESPYLLLANILRQREKSDDERATLTELARIDDAAPTALMRLLELDAARGDWEAVALNAARLRAVDPLTPHPHRFLADAAEKLGRPDEALLALRSLLAVSPDDPADAHFRIARLLEQKGDRAAAKRHVLMSLEEAPRYRAAQELLLELVEAPATPPAAGP